eukprot:260734_1
MGADVTTETKDTIESPATQSNSSGDTIEIKPNIKPGFARNMSGTPGGSKSDKSSHSYILDGMPTGETAKKKKQKEHSHSDKERKSKKARGHRDKKKKKKKKKKRHKSEENSKSSSAKLENRNENHNTNVIRNNHQNTNETHNESLRAMFKQKYTERPPMELQPHRTPKTKPKHISQPNHVPKHIYQPKQKPQSKTKPGLALMPIYSTDNGDAYDKTLSGSTDGRQGYLANPIRLIDEHSQNIWNQVFDGDCPNIADCIATQRIVRALKWYRNVRGDGDKVWKKIKHKKYGTNLISDYHHLLHSHLDKGDTEKAKICNEYKIVVDCDGATCHGYKRKHCQSNPSDSHVPFYVSCLDTIHCLFVH